MNWNLSCYTDVVLESPLIGDKVKLPTEILNQIMQSESNDLLQTDQSESSNNEESRIKFPITFMIKGDKSIKEMVVSVLEFNSEPNMIYVPQWIFHNLYPLEFGDMITISLYSGGTTDVTIPKGQFVKFRPHNYEFLQINNHKEILEEELKNYGLLNLHSTISFEFCTLQFNLDIIELNPAKVVDIIDTDLVVDFEPPVDYIEPPPESSPLPPSPSLSSSSEPLLESPPEQSEQEFVPFSGKGYRLGNE